MSQVLFLDNKHFPTKFGFLLSLGMRSLPAILLFVHVSDAAELSLETILSDGLFLSVLCSDIIIAKMADRDLHSLVPIIAMASVLSNSFIYAAVALYHLTVMFDICSFLHLPLLNPVINVYVLTHVFSTTTIASGPCSRFVFAVSAPRPRRHARIRGHARVHHAPSCC